MSVVANQMIRNIASPVINFLTLNVNRDDSLHEKIAKIVGSVLLNGGLGASVAFIASGLTYSPVVIATGTVTGGVVGLALTILMIRLSQKARIFFAHLDLVLVARGVSKIAFAIILCGVLTAAAINGAIALAGIPVTVRTISCGYAVGAVYSGTHVSAWVYNLIKRVLSNTQEPVPQSVS